MLEVETMAEVVRGTVSLFRFERGYGFIHVGAADRCIGSGCKDCIFVHYTGLSDDVPRFSGKKTLNPGDEVTFQIQDGNQGDEAFNVRVVGWSEKQ